MRILVSGASGFAGSMLLPRLLAEGHEVRALSRDPSRVREALAFLPSETQDHPQQEPKLFTGDSLTGEGLTRAFDGVEVAYYLIHSMESPSRSRSPNALGSVPSHFPERERLSAEHFAERARAAGVQRIVYLGGLLPEAGKISPHLESRMEVERILLDAVPDSIALRSSIVIGARSRSFRLMVRLLERLPIVALPAWRRHRTQPIDARDLVEFLIASASAADFSPRSLDIAGPDILTYEEMLERITELMLLRRPTLKLKVTMTPIAARLAARIASEDPELILPLMEGLETDLLPAPGNTAEQLGVELHSFDAAVEHALGEWERVEPLLAR